LEKTCLYGGISGAILEPETFDLGDGVVLSRTYAHLMSPYLMAFAPPGPKGYHPAPWSAAEGGFGVDIEIELKVPATTSLSDSFGAREIIWWIAALMRIVKSPFLTVPVVSDHQFHAIPEIEEKPKLEPFESERRIFQPAEPASRLLGGEALSYVREKWIPAGRLLLSNSRFYTAVTAFDSATIAGRSSASLLTLWGGIEQLFSPSPGELRFRVASLLASYLEPQGDSRLKLYREILKLYNERSIAAHTAKEIDDGALVHTYVLMRNALIRMIDEGRVPGQEELERALFSAP
jgi:hypothetical protein